MERENCSFENLEVYKKALEFVDSVYDVVGIFPQEEKYNLTEQIRRAAVSVCLNIAEGSGGSKNEFIQFLKISRRSVKECIAILTIALRRKYISAIVEDKLRQKCIELSKMLCGLLRSMDK